MKRILIALFLVLFHLTAWTAGAATYYVDDDCATPGDGTTATCDGSGTDDPMSFSSMRTTDFADNDTINFQAGDVYTGQFYLSATTRTRSGITIQGAEFDGKTFGTNGKPYLDGDNYTPSGTALFAIDGNHSMTNLTVKDFEVKGVGNLGSTDDMMLFDEINGLTLDAVLVFGDGASSGKKAQGIRIKNPGGAVVVKNSTIYDIGPTPDDAVDDGDCQCLVVRRYDGETTHPTSVNIFNNTIYSCRSDTIIAFGMNIASNKQGYAVNIYNNTLYSFGENATDVKQSWNVNIYNNIAYSTVDNHGGTTYRPVFSVHSAGVGQYPTETLGSGFVTIYNNKIGPNKYDTDNEIFEAIQIGAGSDDPVTIRHNHIIDGAPGVYVFTTDDHEIFSNIIELTYTPTNYVRDDWLLRNDGDDVNIYNNTLVSASTTAGGITHQDTADALCEYKNNIVKINSADDWAFDIETGGVTPVVDYNTYDNDGTGQKLVNDKGTSYTNVNFSSWATGDHANDKNRDPDLGSSPFKLNSTSSEINTGNTIGAAYDDGLDPSTTDFTTSPPTVATLDQDSYGAGWERGAWVYSTIFTPKAGNWRWFSDTNAEPVVGDALAAEDVKPTLANNTDIIRLRLEIVEEGGLAGGNYNFEIKYGTGPAGPFTSMGAGNHWNWANGVGTAGAANTTYLVADSGTDNGIKYESTSQTDILGASAVYEGDWAIVPTATVNTNTTYYFQITIFLNTVPADISYGANGLPQVLTAAAVAGTGKATINSSGSGKATYNSAGSGKLTR
jgi:hypothetical protein